jgi:hypothetical protein
MPGYAGSGQATLLFQNQQVALLQQATGIVGRPSIAVQLERNRSLAPTGVSLQVYFTDANGHPASPGAFEIDVQTSDLDEDIQYVTAEAFTGPLNAGFAGNVDLSGFYARYVRVFVRTLASAVFTNVYITSFATAGGAGSGGGGGGGGGPALQVNGTPTGDQALLNLVAGANITITDEGAGAVEIATGKQSFDSTVTGLAQPVGNAIFTFPSAATPGTGANNRLEIIGVHNTGDGTQLPLVYIKEAGAPDPTNLSGNGTLFAINADPNFFVEYFRITAGNISIFRIDQNGAMFLAGPCSAGQFSVGSTWAVQGAFQVMNAPFILSWSSNNSNGGLADLAITRKSSGILQIAEGGAAGNNGSLDCLLVNTGQIAQPARLTAQTASVPATSLQTQTAGILPAGLYRLTYYLNVIVAGTAGTVQFEITYTDDTTAQTQTSTAVSLTTLGNAAQGVFVFYTAGGVNVQYETIVSGETGAPEYNLTIQAERLV